MSSEKETLRLEAFSDGLFAIAITLLALELPFARLEHVPNNNALTRAFWHNWPSYLAFVLSFLSILIMWINHHAIFRHIHRISIGTMFANGVLLLLLAAVPYPTSLVAEYFNTPAANSAMAVYAGLFILINLAYNWLWYVASTSQDCLKPGTDEQTIAYIRRVYLWGFPAYLIAFAAAFFSAALSIFICFILWIYWGLASRKYIY